MADSENVPPQPLCLPAPDTAGTAGRGQSADPGRAGRNHRRRRRASGLPTREEILAELNTLKGALAANWVKPAQANAMARVYQLMLQCLGSGDGRTRGSAELQATLADLARRDPQTLNALEPFLTDEQFANIMTEVAKGSADAPRQGA